MSVRSVVVLAAVAAVAFVGYGIFHEPPMHTPQQCKDIYEFIPDLTPKDHPECFKPPLNVWLRSR